MSTETIRLIRDGGKKGGMEVGAQKVWEKWEKLFKALKEN